MMPDTPHLSFPFRREGGRVAVVEQDTSEHVMSCEHVIVRCPVGHRPEKPDFGWAFPEFATAPIDTGALEAALERWEPRGEADATEWGDAANAAVRNIRVEIKG